MERRNGGRPFSIIINGRRLSDISDLREVPLEALAEVEILPTTSASKYGFPVTDQILNLVLKEHFAAISADAGARVPTEGGGKTGNAALRYINIEKERRFNASASWQGTEALAARDRRHLLEDGADDSVLTPYRSLLPSSRILALTAGLATPVGSVSFNISGSLNDSVSHQLSRFFQADAPTDAGLGSNPANNINTRAVIDNSHAHSYQLGTSASGAINRINWSAELTGNVTRSRTTSEPSRLLIVGLSHDDSATAVPDRYVPLIISSNSSTLGAALTANTPLIALPAGELALNARVSAETQHLSSGEGSGPSRRHSFRQSRRRIHAGAEIPILGPDLPVVGFLGNLSMSVSGDWEWISQGERLPSYNSALEWRPKDFITVSLSRSRTRSAPILVRTNDPVIYSPGVLVADLVSGEYVLVMRISGGAPDLRATSESEGTARLTVNKTFGATNGSASFEYSSVETANPVVLTAYPSILFQSLFPDRFARDADGRLTAIDTRPFNALSERRKVVRSNLHLSGHTGNAEGEGAGDPLDWDLSATHEWTLRDVMNPSAEATSINLLKTPLDAVQGTPRHKLNLEASATYRQMAIQIGARWRSGADVKDISAAERGSIRYAAFWTADAEISWTLRNSRSTNASRAWRMWLSVENILNRRLSVRDSSGRTPLAFQPAFLDPIGRSLTIRISHTL